MKTITVKDFEKVVKKTEEVREQIAELDKENITEK